MHPLERRWLNRCAWLLGLSVLFMAQSKTAWLAFALCSGSVLALRWAPRLRAQLGNVHDGIPALAGIALALLGVAAGLGLLLFGNLGDSLQRFMLSSEGSQLSSMTGRDRIWVIAWEEWQSHPVWGWGLQIWDDSYRRAIGMANATHAHNQLMDTLSRSGLVGAAALTLYLGVLCVLSLRCARASKGLSVALLLALLLRAGSEVPLLLIGYGPDLIIHLLLLITLAAHRSALVGPSRRVEARGKVA
jgi:O-antigen ligase